MIGIIPWLITNLPGKNCKVRLFRNLVFVWSPQKIITCLLVADKDFFGENAVSPIRKRSPKEQTEIYVRYQKTVLTEAGVDVSSEPDMFVKIMKRVRQLSHGVSLAIFDDVLSILKRLKEKNLTLGLLTFYLTNISATSSG